MSRSTGGEEVITIVAVIGWILYIGFAVALFAKSMTITTLVVLVFTVGVLLRVLFLWAELEREQRAARDDLNTRGEEAEYKESQDANNNI